ncbi:MAG: SIS domain-containing protein [Deinococcales bacterium]
MNPQKMPLPKMLVEIREVPVVLERQLQGNRERIAALARAMTERQPRFAMTIARGTSDHAANFLQYVLESQFGLVTASAAPSVVTAYNAKLQLEGALVIAISQSGQSPDVVGSLAAAREQGALTVAIINTPNTPLEAAAEFCLPMQAGTEEAVAATKSFIASLFAPLMLTAALKSDHNLQTALERLPQAALRALESEQIAIDRAERYRYAESMVALGRGLHFPLARETALKLKETSVISAEAFSSAEFAHGPIILIESGFPVIAFLARDATHQGTLERYKDLAARGAELVLIGADVPELNATVRLSTPDTGHILTDPIPAMLAAYLFAGHLSLARGLNPDAPRMLSKVTKTL